MRRVVLLGGITSVGGVILTSWAVLSLYEGGFRLSAMLVGMLGYVTTLGLTAIVVLLLGSKDE